MKNDVIHETKKIDRVPVQRVPSRTPLKLVNQVRGLIENKVVCELGSSAGDLLAEMSVYAKAVIGIEKISLRHEVALSRNIDSRLGDYRSDPIPQADVYYIWSKTSEHIFLIKKICRNPDFDGVIICSAQTEKEISGMEELASDFCGHIHSFSFDESLPQLGPDFIWRQSGMWFYLTIDVKEYRRNTPGWQNILEPIRESNVPKKQPKEFHNIASEQDHTLDPSDFLM